MKIVIDIPDYNLGEVQNGSIACKVILDAVKNGTVLPKGHGDLVERKCKNKICRDCVYEDVCYRLDASVIIPADKGE